MVFPLPLEAAVIINPATEAPPHSLPDAASPQYTQDSELLAYGSFPPAPLQMPESEESLLL